MMMHCAFLQEVDREKVKQFLKDIQKQLHGTYVIDLASLRDTAKAVLPLLESYEETQPYAGLAQGPIGLSRRSRRVPAHHPAAESRAGPAAQPAPNPAPKLEREVWVKKLAARPWPEAAKPYVPRLKPIFTAQKVPPQLVWLAEVESSFDPRARSPAGAVGLFQLMPATAKRFGLRTSPLDQRLRPEESAQAAAKYLDYLHGQFKDWRLALAAYNAGEGTVQRLMKQHNAKTFDGIAIALACRDADVCATRRGDTRASRRRQAE